MSSKIYLEGGGDSKELHARCREGFRKLLESCGFKGRMPQLVACGGRHSTFDSFCTAHRCDGRRTFVAMLIDSEEPLADPKDTWQHLKDCDRWEPPAEAVNEQVLLMTTCMETWIIADRKMLAAHFRDLQESALPPLSGLESRSRHDVQDRLVRATRNSPNRYEKGKRLFELLARLSPAAIEPHLPSFARVRRILNEKL